MKPRITLITLGVDDLQRAVRFYRDGLGLKTEGVVGAEFEHGAVAFFDLQAGLKLALWPRKSIAHDTGIAPGSPNATDFTIGHNVSSKVEVDAVMDSQKGRCSRRKASARHLLGAVTLAISRTLMGIYGKWHGIRSGIYRSEATLSGRKRTRMVVASILWRRLDTPGHDACSLEESDAGWRLDGTAVFLQDGAPARLTYHVVCDLAWRTQHGRVEGWLGGQSVEFSIARTNAGVWTLNGVAVSSLENCVDLDLGFTPATNLLPLRRLAPAEGQAANAPAAWLNVSAGTLEVLSQRYERRSETTYWYEAPSVHYAALLEVAPTGFVRRYPGLWEAEP